MDNPEGAQSTCDLKSEDEPKWPNDAVSEHPLEQPSRNESFVSLQTPNLPLDELEAYSMKSLEELDEIDELEARLGLRLMLINDVERASSLSNSQRPSLVIHIPLAVYEKQYQAMFETDLNNQVEKGLVQKALNGDFRSSCFRSICWKIFLNVLPENADGWHAAIQSSRDEFDNILTKYTKEKNKPTQPNCSGAGSSKENLIENNPLSQQESSWWNRHFQNVELEAIIDQDVSRTFPEVDFFHQPEIQRLLRNLLFIYARQHPDVQYKQGMHELLAPLVFVLHSDHQAFLHAKETNILSKDNDLIARLEMQLAEHHLQADAYILFEKLMEHVKCWYLPEKENQKGIELQPFSQQQQVLSLSALGRNLHYINESLLKACDLELYQHLQYLQIEPQIYGIRWLRLLFGREFAIEDLLVLWDAIFADNFKICNHIFTAMLVVIRSLLINGDYLESMGHLMRYPHVPDVGYIVQLALHIRDPQKYPEPEDGQTSVLPNAMHSTFSKRSGLKDSLRADYANGSYTKNDKPANRFFMFAQKLINANRRNRDQTYTSPKATFGSSTASDTNAASNEFVKRLQRFNISNKTHSSSSNHDLEEPAFDSHQRDFCVQHLSKQIHILQNTLQEKVTNESFEVSISQVSDTIAMAIAELKKIRDVIEGSLLLDEVRELSQTPPLQSESVGCKESSECSDLQEDLESNYSNISISQVTENMVAV